MKTFASRMTLKLRGMIFFLFFLSGFCSLLYQVVWLRLAYASFGVITPVLSVVISVFMLGLSLGTYFGGRWINALVIRGKTTPILFYALTEFLIGIGAFIVPSLYSFGSRLLLGSGEMNSFNYLLFSGLIIAVSILPWCILMGFTYPLMMSFLKSLDPDDNAGFSYLYTANVAGAMCGTLLTALVLIEALGFRNSLLIAALSNFFIALISIGISARHSFGTLAVKNSGKNDTAIEGKTARSKLVYSLLFLTGFASMAMEVTWVRAFTPVLSTTVYSFASLLTIYLFATWIGSSLYRFGLSKGKILSNSQLLALLCVFSMLPVSINDPRIAFSVAVTLLSIFPFSAVLGYLTPKLIDDYSSGRPYEASKAYTSNVVGCITGPLFASYILLPQLGVRLSLLALAVPFLLFFPVYYFREAKKRWVVLTVALSVILFFGGAVVNISFEDACASQKGSVTRRDYTATVIAAGNEWGKMLLVNGVGITKLTPITKMMAHLPLVLCKNKLKSMLVICMGMGTTYRSGLSWGIQVTTVELVPSVKDVFGYYFADAEKILENPKGKIVIDDGRRFLSRTDEMFDVITIDPPPPVEAAGSSLLYSEEFYRLAKKHLKEGGILQQWFPEGEFLILQAAARSICNSFSYVRAYKSIEGWGVHFLASMSPIDIPQAAKAIARMPPTAKNDLVEWYSGYDPKFVMETILGQELPLPAILNSDRKIVITDDSPYNEYYFLRRHVLR